MAQSPSDIRAVEAHIGKHGVSQLLSQMLKRGEIEVLLKGKRGPGGWPATYILKQ